MDLKKLRKVRIKTLVLSMLGPSIIILGSISTIFFLNTTWVLVVGIVMIILLFIISVFISQPLLDNYKKIIFQESLKDFLNIESNNFHSSLKESYLYENSLISLSSNEYIETTNYMKLKNNDVEFYTADFTISISKKRKKTQGGSVKTSGYWFLINFNNNYNYYYNILTKSKENILLIKKLEKNGKKIMAKSEKFNSNFVVFTDKKNQTKYLEDKIVTSILKVKEFLKDDISLCIEKNHLHGVVLNKIMPFEPSLKKDIDKNQIDDLRKKYKIISSFVNFNLEN